MDSSAAISFHKANKAYGPQPHIPLTRVNGQTAPVARLALDDISFEVWPGEIFGLLGPNGSGKSTLIRLAAMRLSADSGRVCLFGHDVSREQQAAQAMVDRTAVDVSFFKKLSPVENLLYGARAFGARPGETRRRVFDVLARLGLEHDDYYRPMETLSRGVQQKVAIARAFLGQPRLLLLDEPTTGLDLRSKREVQRFVRELRDHHGATVLLSTHDLAEAEALCDRVAVLDRGRLAAVDTPEGLRRRAGALATLEDAFLQLTARTASAASPAEVEAA